MNYPIQYEIPMLGSPDSVACDWALYKLENQSPTKFSPDHQQRILKLADTIIKSKLKAWAAITSPGAAKEYLRIHLQARQEEVMAILFLNSKHHIIRYEELFKGTIDSAMVYTRVLVKRALYHNAAACMMVHNHPSWNPTPSEADKHITRRVFEALALVDIKLLDHFVVGIDGAVSMAELGEI